MHILRARPHVLSLSLFSTLLLASLALAPSASADTPPWLRAAAQQTVPPYPDTVDAVVLLDEQSTTVNDKGEIKTLYRKAYKILRAKGRERGRVVVHFDKDTKLTFLKAWTIPASGKDYEVKEKDALELGISDSSLYEDTRYKILDIPAPDPGNVIGYEYEQRKRPYVLEDQWWFQEDVPVRQARYNLSLPEGWGYQAAWRNFPGANSKTSSESQGQWELSDVPALHIEPAMPSAGAVLGRLVVTLYPSRESLRNKSLRTWSDVGNWYSQLTLGRRDITPEIRFKAAELTANAPDTVAKIRALAAFAQRDVRYVSIQIGIGGYQPNPAGSILTNRYGDCKDKATVMSSLLKAIGIDSHYVLINTRRGVVSPDVPSAMTFNHVILAIRLPADTDVSTMFASRPHPELGRLLYFDPTDDMTPLGYLPSSLQANYGLLILDNSGELIELPLLPPSTNRLLRTAKFTITPAGALDGEVNEIRWGAPAVSRRNSLVRVQASERPKILEGFLNAFISNFTLTRADVEGLEDYDKTLLVTFKFVARNYAKPAGNLLLFRPRVLGEQGIDLLERFERKYPINFGNATIHSDAYEFILPPGFVVDELPPPVDVDYGFASYKSTIEVKDNVLHYNRTFQIKEIEVPTDRLPDLKKFFRQIAADERASAVLKRTAN